LRRSIEASQRGSRRLRARRFKDLFGFRAWSPARRKMVSRLLSGEGIVVQPALEQAGRDHLLVLSLPAPGVTTGLSKMAATHATRTIQKAHKCLTRAVRHAGSHQRPRAERVTGEGAADAVRVGGHDLLGGRERGSPLSVKLL
jgi:hypothetical protein